MHHIFQCIYSNYGYEVMPGSIITTVIIRLFISMHGHKDMDSSIGVHNSYIPQMPYLQYRLVGHLLNWRVTPACLQAK